MFALTANGALSFKAAKDFEAPDDADGDGDYEITVRVTDGANQVDAALVVRLSDVDDAAPRAVERVSGRDRADSRVQRGAGHGVTASGVVVCGAGWRDGTHRGMR